MRPVKAKSKTPNVTTKNKLMSMKRKRTPLSLSSALLIVLSLNAGHALGATSNRVGFSSYSEWVRHFESITKDSSSDVKQATDTWTSKRAAKYTAFSRFLPKLDLQVQYSRTKQDSLFQTDEMKQLFGVTGTGDTVTANSLSYSLTGSLPIYRRAVQLGYSIASIEEDSYEVRKDLVRLKSEVVLHQHLSNLLGFKFQKLSIDKAKESFNDQLKTLRLKYDLGDKSKIDLLRAEENLANLELRLDSLQTDLSHEIADTATFLGVDIKEILDFVAGLPENKDDLLKSVESELEAIKEPDFETLDLSKSLTLQSQELDDELVSYRSQMLMAADWPSLDLFGQWTKDGTSTNDLFPVSNPNYAFGIKLTIPLFEGGSTVSNVLESRYLRLASNEKTNHDRRMVIQKLDDLRDLSNSLKKSLRTLEISKSRSEEILKLAQKSYDLGRLNQIDVLDAQADWLTSNTNFVQTKLKLGQAYREWWAEMGGNPQ